jgi:hypothetical protein
MKAGSFGVLKVVCGVFVVPLSLSLLENAMVESDNNTISVLFNITSA